MTREPGTGEGSFNHRLYHGDDSRERLCWVHDAGGVKVVVSATVVADGDEKDDEDESADDVLVEVANVVLEAAAAVEAAVDAALVS